MVECVQLIQQLDVSITSSSQLKYNKAGIFFPNYFPIFLQHVNPAIILFQRLFAFQTPSRALSKTTFVLWQSIVSSENFTNFKGISAELQVFFFFFLFAFIYKHCLFKGVLVTMKLL